MEPAALHGLFGLLRFLEIHNERVRPFPADLPGNIGLQDGREIVVFQAALHVQTSFPCRSQLRQGILRLENRMVGRQFRLTVIIINPCPRQPRHKLSQDLHGHD